MAHQDLTGHTLGQYTITARLGRGGMADVYKAYHPKLEVYRAIKVIRPEFVTATDFRERFQKEAQAVAALRHPNIVQIHDFGEEGDAYYMVMEFIEGRDLKHIISEDGKIRPIRRAVDIADQIAGALHYAHSRGLIHRDIKPENIMINEDGLPILMDFGIAKLLTANTQLTQTGMGIGTPSYMAPEQAQALPEIGPQADIYSLSVVLYEMLTGQVPFSADTPMAVMLKAINDPMPMPRQFSNDISEDLQQVVLKGTAKEPNNRYASARRLQEALHSAMEKEAPGEQGPRTTEVLPSRTGATEEAGARDDAATRQRPTKRGRGGPIALVAVIVALALGAAAYLYWAPGAGTTDRLAADGERAQTAAAEPAQGKEPGPGKDALTESGQAESTGEAGAGEAGPSPAAGNQAVSTEQPANQLAAAQPESGGGESGQQAAAGGATAGEQQPVTPGGDGGEPGRSSAEEPAQQPTSGTMLASSGTGSSSASQPPPMTDGGALRLGRYVKERVAVPGRAVAYTLDADAGQTIYFDHVDNTEPTRRMEFTLTAPDGQTRVFRSRSDYGPVTLGQTGTYTLVARPGDSRVSGFEFVVWDLDPPQVDGGLVRLGQPVKGHTSVPGQTVSYSLFANAGQTIVFDQVESTEATDFTLTAPDGTSRVFKTRGNHGPVALNQSGTYRLVADPQGDYVSQFKFVVAPAGVN